MHSLSAPTLYPDVNEILFLLLDGAKAILQDQFVGMYLYGSLSSGDFDPQASDIDFLFVTAKPLSREKICELEALHQQLWSGEHACSAHLEGAYVPQGLVRLHDPNGLPCPTVNEGKFYSTALGSDWIIQRHVVREHGVVVEGPDPKTLIDFVSSQEIRAAVRGVLNEWWFPMLENPSWLQNHPRGYHSYAILTMCRALHALQHGTIVSKPVAAEWAKATLGARWASVIDIALLVRKQNQAEFELLEDALELIHYVKEIPSI